MVNHGETLRAEAGIRVGNNYLAFHPTTKTTGALRLPFSFAVLKIIDTAQIHQGFEMKNLFIT